jgi:hypothetical protein
LRGEGHAQLLDWQVLPPAHALPHLPQLLSSFVTSEQVPLHAIVPDGHPLLHAYVVPARAQKGVPPSGSQDVVHAPQWLTELRLVSQPAAGFPGQWAYPGLQLNMQVPFMHARPVAATCERVVQSLLQSPHV